MQDDSREAGILTRAAGYVSERAVALLLSAIVGILVARHLGPEQLGLLTYVQAVFALLSPVALLGLQLILVREFSTRSDWRVVLASALSRQLPAALAISVVAAIVVAASRGFEGEVVLMALALIPLPVLTLGTTLRYYLEASGRVKEIVVVGLTAAVAASIVKVGALLTDASLWVFAAAASVEAGIVLLGLMRSVSWRRSLGSLRAVVGFVDRELARKLVGESWPLILAQVAVVFYMRADLVMLGLLSGDQDTGVYVAAARLSEAWYFLPVAAMAALRPRLSRLYAAEKHGEYERLTQRSLTLAVAASVLFALATLVVSTPLVRAIYGSAFDPSAVVLRIHLFAAPFVFLGVVASQWFIDRSMTQAVLVRSVVGAVTNIALNLVLIPTYGANGAAVATLVSYAATVLYNGVRAESRPLFRLQLRAVALRWL